MAAYAALVSLLNNIQLIMNHPRPSTSLDNKYIQTLLQKAGFLLDFIEANNNGEGSKEAEALEREIASAAHAAEDAINESYIMNYPYFHAEELSPRCSQLDMQHKLQDIDVIMKKASEFKQKWGLKEEQPTHIRSPLMESGATTAMVGLEAEFIQLLDDLTGHSSNQKTISIIGMGGIGKTTLAKNVYENQLINEHFQLRAWATISQHHNAHEILLQLLSCFGRFTNGDVEDLGLQLHKTLSGRRYLIILDDMWSVKAWDDVRRFLPNNKNGSRIVLTTRLSNLANDCGSSPFMMNLLDENDSWKLFCEKAFQNEVCPPGLTYIGTEISRLCKGLALSIVVIGGLLLKSPRTVGYWEDVANNLKSTPNSKEKQESLDVLSLSYTHLPPHLKPCFLYMGVFKEDSDIPVSKIVSLWIAEGLLKPMDPEVLDEVAEGYLKDLIDRNLVLVGRRRKNGNIGRCRIHDLLRDLCIKVGVQQELFHANNHRLTRVQESCVSCDHSPETYRNVNLRYLSYRDSTCSHVGEFPAALPLMWNLQTLIIGGRRYPWYPIIVAPSEIWKMRQLRHVEGNRIYLPSPRTQDGLFMLRTLKTPVNLRLSEEVCKIIPNIKKLHLVYDFELGRYSDILIEYLCNLGRLHRLESLNLSIKSSRYPIPDCDLKRILIFPSSLNRLTLSACGLQWEDLTMIGSLPQLQVLKLERNSVTHGRHWSPVDGQFLSLKFLRISSCNLFSWDADNSHFPNLEKLILEILGHLEEIPLGIGDIPTLELIRVENCSNSAAISALKIKEQELESQGNDFLQVQVRVSPEDLETFNQKLGTEELTINNIQFRC